MTEKSTLRIVIIGPAEPFRGGIAHFSNRLSQELEKQFTVDLLTFTRQYPALLFPGEAQVETSEWQLPSQPVRILDSIGPASWHRSGKWLATQRPDVILLVHWMPFFVPSYLSVLRSYVRELPSGLPIAHVSLLLHTVFPHKWFPFTRFLMRRLISRADSVLTLSQHTAEQACSLVPHATVFEGFHPVYDMLETCVDKGIARARLGLEHKITMLFFGYIRRYKGLDVLIEALPRIRERLDVQLIVAGEFYEDRRRIERQVERLKLRGSIRFFSDYIPMSEVHLYFSAADVVVLPYRSAVQSGVAMMALSFGKPLITSDVDALSELLPEGTVGLGSPPEDAIGLANAVTRFFEGDPDRFHAGVEAHKRKFSWEVLSDDLADFFRGEVDLRNVVSRGGRRYF